MSFWIAGGIIAVLTGLVPVLALLRARVGHARGAEADVRVYRDQMTGLARDVERGVIAAEEAERIRVEIGRRLLDADRRAALQGTTSGAVSPIFALGLGMAVLVSAFALYTWLGAPNYADMPLAVRIAHSDQFRATREDQTTAEARVPVQVDPAADQAFLELMVKLRAALQTRPDDLGGYQLLARNEAALGDFAAARKAQERVIALKGDAARPDDFATLAYLMIAAVGGYVSPQAEAALTATLQRDPKNKLARYYAGVMFDQAGRPDLTFNMWRPLLEDSAPDDPWVATIRANIKAVAAAAGVEYVLPDLPGLPGPSAADVAAASDMTATDRDAMIRNMVQGLSDRLASEGGTPEEWARLISALGVLKEPDRARAIYAEALATFASDPAAIDTIRAAGTSAGVAE